MLRRSVYNQERETSICKQNVICYNLATLGYQSICFFLNLMIATIMATTNYVYSNT